ncbi:MAG: nucleotidyltransferase family protein [Elainellaceae cyanobacterium]
MTTVALILAAGFSTRMGQCKASLPWGDRHTLLTYQIEQFLSVHVFPVVVLGQHNADPQTQRLSDCAIAINPDASRGKVSSILTGLALLPTDTDALFISAVDQPRPAWIYQTLLEAHAHAADPPPITAPIKGDRLGHPLLFSQRLIPELQTIRENTLGLRAIVNRYFSQIQTVTFDTDLIFQDLNTPERYRQSIAERAVQDF